MMRRVALTPHRPWCPASGVFSADAAMPYPPPMNGQRTVLIMLAAGFALLVVCGGVAAVGFIFARAAASGGDFGSFKGTELPCLVDANGDGTLDVAGFSGTPDQQTVPTALDGRTGKVLWTQAAYREGSHAHCGDEHTLLVSHPGFHLDGLDAKTGKRKWTISLEDEVQSVWPGHGCVEVVLANMKHDGVQTSTGARTTCKGEEPPADPLTHADASLTLKWSARAGDLEATLSTHVIGNGKCFELAVIAAWRQGVEQAPRRDESG